MTINPSSHLVDLTSLFPYDKKSTILHFANHTGVDIHLQITGDAVEGNKEPFQLNHAGKRAISSREIEFGNKAKYLIQVWKNNQGLPGTYLGSFEHSVRYNLAGWEDQLELIIMNIEGKTYLRAISSKEIGQIILLLWGD